MRQFNTPAFVYPGRFSPYPAGAPAGPTYTRIPNSTNAAQSIDVNLDQLFQEMTRDFGSTPAIACGTWRLMDRATNAHYLLQKLKAQYNAPWLLPVDLNTVTEFLYNACDKLAPSSSPPPPNPSPPSGSCALPAHVLTTPPFIAGGSLPSDSHGDRIGSWNSREERNAWAQAHPACPPPAPYCDPFFYPPRPYTPSEYDQYVQQNPGCTPPFRATVPGPIPIPNPMPVPIPGTIPVPAPTVPSIPLGSQAKSFWADLGGPALVLSVVLGVLWWGRKP